MPLHACLYGWMSALCVCVMAPVDGLGTEERLYRLLCPGLECMCGGELHSRGGLGFPGTLEVWSVFSACYPSFLPTLPWEE